MHSNITQLDQVNLPFSGSRIWFCKWYNNIHSNHYVMPDWLKFGQYLPNISIQLMSIISSPTKKRDTEITKEQCGVSRVLAVKS